MRYSTKGALSEITINNIGYITWGYGTMMCDHSGEIAIGVTEVIRLPFIGINVACILIIFAGGNWLKNVWYTVGTLCNNYSTTSLFS